MQISTQIYTQIVEAMGTYCTSASTYLGGGRGNLFPYVPVVTYVSTNNYSVASTKVSTDNARELELLAKKRKGAKF